eukprot:Em0011g884a
MCIQVTSLDKMAAPHCLPISTGAGGGGSVSVGNATQYTITGLQEFSVYILTITASIGVGSSPPASVLVNTSSAAPSAPPKTSSSVTISWGEVPCQDQNSVIVEYRVLYGAVTSGVGGTVATSGRTLTVNGLSPYTNYSIEVSAVNSDGAMGPYSSPLFVLTHQSTPGPVGGYQAFNKTFTTITLTWQPPPVPNGVIIMYQVTYSINGVVNTYNTTTPPVTITELVPRTTYTFSVTAYIITGPGTPLQVQTSTADISHVSGVVVSAMNTTSVRVSWLAVQLPPDGILTGYTVYYLSLPNTSKRQSGGYTSHTFPPTTTWGDINNLNPNGVYQFSVVAQVTIMGQLYSGEMDTSLVNTPTITPGSSNLVSTCNCGGVLAGSLVAEFVVLAVAMVPALGYKTCSLVAHDWGGAVARNWGKEDTGYLLKTGILPAINLSLPKASVQLPGGDHLDILNIGDDLDILNIGDHLDILNIGGHQDTLNIGGYLDILNIGGHQNILNIGGYQDILDNGGHQDTLNIGGRQDIPNVDGHLHILNIGGHLDILDIGGHQDTLDIGGHLDILNIGGHQDTLNIGGHQDTLNIGGYLDILNIGGHQNILNIGGHQDILDNGGHQDTLNIGGRQDIPNVDGHLHILNIGGHLDILDIGGHQDTLNTGGHLDICNIHCGHHDILSIGGHQDTLSIGGSALFGCIRQSGGYTSHTFPPASTSGDINNLNPNGVYQFRVVAQVTIMGQLYSGEMDTSLVNTSTITPGSSNLVSTCNCGGVLAGSLVAEFVVLAVAMVTIEKRQSCGKVHLIKEKRRYRKKCRGISQREELRVQKLHADEEAMKTIQAVYPQCTICHYHFKSQTLLDKHMCDGIKEPQDALNITMRHANELLSKMDLSVDDAIAHASNIFVDGTGEIPYATFEPNFYSGWAQTRKNMHPELTFECWKAGECRESGRVKISADGVYARLEEMQLQKIICLSELPLVGKIRAVYQSIGTKSQDLLAGGRKRGRPHSDEGKKKSRVNLDELDVSKDLLKWTKPELEAYLVHHHIKKTGNKPELIRRVQEHMADILQ